MANSIEIVTALPETARLRRVWLVDIWGVMHEGTRPFAAAVDACRTFRGRGGIVVLVSNAPRPGPSVAQQLARIGIAPEAYDAIISSGDISRALVAGYSGQAILHIGPERDLPLFDGLGVRLAAADDAAAIVCTGLVDDERETAETYRPLLTAMAARGVAMVCANPDLTVERGGRLIPCAGAVAALYAGLGGTVSYGGKPYAPIYDAAAAIARDLGREPPLSKADFLAIGDGVRTDIEGAHRFGIDSVYVASAVSLPPGCNTLDRAALDILFPPGAPRPIAAMADLAW